MPTQGFYQFDDVHLEKAIMLAAREINTDDGSVTAAFRFTHPPVTAGVRTARVFVHQSATPAPKASKVSPITFALEANPQLDEDTYRHYQAVAAGSEFDPLPRIWWPFPFHVVWQISTGRVNYSSPYFIAGSAGERGVYFEPRVEVRAGGKFIEQLSFVASSPSSTEFLLDSIVTDTRRVIVGDQSANDGNQLHAWMHCLIEVAVTGFEDGLLDPGNAVSTLSLVSAPSPVDYEEDV